MKFVLSVALAFVIVASFYTGLFTVIGLWNPRNSEVAWMLESEFYWPIIFVCIVVFVLSCWAYHRILESRARDLLFRRPIS